MLQRVHSFGSIKLKKSFVENCELMGKARVDLAGVVGDRASVVYPDIVLSGKADLLECFPFFELEFGVLFGKWWFRGG